MLEPQATLNCNGQILSLEQPLIMGIVNVTPDSFYDGGVFMEQKLMLQKVEQMLDAGATIIDVGGMSSRPGAELITVEEELKRVLPAIAAIVKHFPDTLISIDTIYGQVARAAVSTGAAIINDISAGRTDSNMYATVAELGVPYILMHMKGQPKNMQQQANYEDVRTTVLDFFIQEIGKLRALGVKDIIVDPGFGFGKTLAHNYQLLNYLHIFKILDVPILAGLSRKSMIYKALNITPTEALNGTSVLNLVALQQGASILRVHDVKEAKETIQLFQLLQENKEVRSQTE